MRGTDIPVVVIFGPTASGKTALAFRLFTGDSKARLVAQDAEIISADSMQVYRGMDIGTAKPTLVEQNLLPHHLIDIRSPKEQFSVGDFVRLADEACADIFHGGKIPVVMGGTGFYISHFLHGLPSTPESDPSVRASLIARAERDGVAALYRELATLDPERAAQLHENDAYRIIRALEIIQVSGKTVGSFALSGAFRAGYRFFPIYIERNRQELNDRIDARVVEMFDLGLEGEVDSLVRSGFSAADPGLQAIGYREFFDESVRSAGREALIARIQSDSRKYAKRQETYVRPLAGIARFPAGDHERIAVAIRGFLSR